MGKPSNQSVWRMDVGGGFHAEHLPTSDRVSFYKKSSDGERKLVAHYSSNGHEGSDLAKHVKEIVSSNSWNHFDNHE
jgi:hypothetical protein